MFHSLHKFLKTIGFTFYPLYYIRGMNLYAQNNASRKNLVGVELGTGIGRNAKRMLLTLPIKKLYCVEPNGIGKTKQYLKKFSDKLIFLNDYSFNAVDLINEKLDFIYIDTPDGSNSKPIDIKQDLMLYYPKLKKGGIIGGHDFNILSVINPVLSFAKKYNLDINTGRNNDWWCVNDV